MTDLEKLQQMSLHDTAINSLQINFEARQLALVVAPYNEALDIYEELHLSFLGVNKLSSSFLETKTIPFNEVEVTSHEVTILAGEMTVTFIILTGFGEPSAKLSFAFEQVTLNQSRA
ncbi:hypothetical protein QMK33_02180 [Hymenobacter sp. H14-R3]|uniref:hypothetical protein n=1 Tax=Hymenobacter sp. H14-R3 TaxID=3046308 RepID=UPI0024BAF278|nr:hypothetical protein [Hymenobacter sp. H14-R3]MDJ0363944.1 hypothetical protein [Hymenobacter sp. H14-R3]